MRRRSFEGLTVSVGLVMAAVLLVAGSLLLWTHNLMTHEVRQELADEHLFVASSSGLPPDGPQVLTGPQALAYDEAVTSPRIAALTVRISALERRGAPAAKAGAESDVLSLKVELLGQERVRAVLLGAHTTWRLGDLALYGAVVSFVAAAVVYGLTLLGFADMTRASAPVRRRRSA